MVSLKRLSPLFLALTLLMACNQHAQNKEQPKSVAKDSTVKITFKDNAYNHAARYIAGLPQLDSNEYTVLEKKAVWKKYSHRVDSIWGAYEKNRLSIMRDWYGKQFDSVIKSDRDVLYPFSACDFLNIYTLYPNGKKYVLCGLELVGRNPQPKNLSDHELDVALDGLMTGLKTLIERGYFITSYMGHDLYSSQLNGTLPVIYFFMARMNCNIVDQQFVGLDKAGNEHPLKSAMRDSSNASYIRGVKITFQHPGSKKLATMYYFGGDLSDGGIAAHPGYVNFVKANFKNTNTFIKAASYLLHTPQFTSMKSLILAQSHAILTDDSGLPLKAVNDNKWKLTYYGKYNGPTKDFPYIHEADRLAIYNSKDSNKIAPIPFGTGYKWKLNESNLLFCLKK